MKFPLNGQWTVNRSSEKGVELLATKNMDFDQKGFATLSLKTIGIANSDTTDFGRVVSAYYNSQGQISKVFTDDDSPFSISFDNASITYSEDALANQPAGSTDSSGTFFAGLWVTTEASDMKTFDGSAWTDRAVTLASGVRHPLCAFKNRNTLLIGNGNVLKQVNTSFAETTNLTLPSEFEILCVQYNRNLVGITTWNNAGKEAFFFIWDGATASANFGYPIGSNVGTLCVPYKDTFLIFSGNGEVLRWNASGLEKVGDIPTYYSTAVLNDIQNGTTGISTDNAWLVSGNQVFMGLALTNESPNAEKSRYMQTQPSGIWCFDPAVGFYHRYGWSGVKLLFEARDIGQVDATTDIVTVTVTVPETGTPVYCAFRTTGTAEVTALTEMREYYVIKLSSTTFKIASSYTNALAGTAIDLTTSGTGNVSFLFLGNADFGQLDNTNRGTFIGETGASADKQNEDGDIYSEYAWSAGGIPANTASAVGKDVFGVVSRFGENRGYFTTQRLYAPSTTEKWQKVIVRARNLNTDLDKVVVKYRTMSDANMPVNRRASGEATWTDANTFTTTSDLSAVIAGYEVEFTNGAASGYTAHVSSISYNAGTYTVNIDEDIKNIAASDTSWFVVDNWIKLGSITTDDRITYLLEGNTITTNSAFKEFRIDQASPWVQLKIELRGYRVQVEDYELVGVIHKPAI